jgi:hypothetical protein
LWLRILVVGIFQQAPRESTLGIGIEQSTLKDLGNEFRQIGSFATRGRGTKHVERVFEHRLRRETLARGVQGIPEFVSARTALHARTRPALVGKTRCHVGA